MGIITKSNCVKGLFNSSSEESLHISEQSEDEHQLQPPVPPPSIPHHHHGQRQRIRPVPMSFMHLRKCLGKKKCRRYQDVNHLMTLAEEDELDEVSIQDLLPSLESQFARLLRDGTALATWNEFAESTEDDQKRLLEATQPKCPYERKCGTNGEILTGENAFLNIDSSLRTMLRKSRVPLGLLSYMEQSLVMFFNEKPMDTFISENLSSYERLLLHAISQYHQLLSKSFDAEDSSEGRFVRVINPHQSFKVPEMLLGDFINSKRQLT